jgi:hypothetical protein
MARASTYGVTSKPSARAIRSAATSGGELPSRYTSSGQGNNGNYLEDDLDAPQVQRKVATRQEAENRVRSQYPQFFETEQEIRSRLERSGEKGSALSRGVNRVLSNNRYSANAEIDGVMKNLQRDYDRQYELEVQRSGSQRQNIDRENRNTRLQAEQGAALERESARLAYGTSNAGSEAAYLSRLQRQKLNEAEALLEAKFLNDPQGQQHFQQVNDYLKQLQNASPAERRQILGQLQEEANALVDEPFDRRKQIVTDRLSTKLRQLNEQFQTLSVTEQYKLDQAIQGLDSDAAAEIEKGITDILNRGGLSSGLLRRLADQIVERREVGAKDAKRVKDLNIESAEQRKRQIEEGEQFETGLDLFDIEQERRGERSVMLSGLISDYTQQGLLADLISGSGNIGTGQGLSGAVARGANGAPLSNIQRARSTILPTYSAPVGSSLDLARQAAQGTITPEQQRAARELLLSGTPSPQLTTPLGSIRTSSPTTQMNAPLRVTNPTSGRAYTGAAATRLQARISRL